MKILFIQKEGGIFGAENYQLKIIPALLNKGIEIEFLRLYTDYQGGQGGDFVERLNSLGVTTHEINIGKIPKLKSLKQIKKLVKSEHYDLVHTHLIHADFHLSLITLLLGGIDCPWVSTKHGYDNDFTAKHGFNAAKQGITPYYLLAKLSERLCTKSYAISHGLRNFFVKTGLAQPDKMKMIHYGFDFEDTSDQLLDQKLRKFDQQIIIAGRLVNFKGHHYLLDVLKLVIKTSPRAGLVIAGSGEIEAQLKSRVENEGLSENVFFAGYSKEVVKWMYNSDVVAVPSISEGFGVVFLEAFNCKKPVVAWDVPSGNELMEEGTSGFLVSPYDTSALAEKIVYILENLDLAKKIGENAYKRLKGYFNLERMTNETLEFYKSALK